MKTRLTFIAVSLTALTGCASLSGYDSTSDFSCAAPEGVSCKSISGVYANKQMKNLPSQKAGSENIDYRKDAATDDDKASTESVVIGDEVFNVSSDEEHVSNEKTVLVKKITGTAPKSGDPIYQEPKVVRVWFAPYEDSNGLLNDQSYSYMVIQSGTWQVEHLKETVQSQGRSKIKTLGN